MSARAKAEKWPDAFVRLLDAYGAKGPTELAQRMGKGKSTVQNWAARGVPQDALVQAHQDTGRGLGWLTLGVVESRNETTQSATSDSLQLSAENLKTAIPSPGTGERVSGVSTYQLPDPIAPLVAREPTSRHERLDPETPGQLAGGFVVIRRLLAKAAAGNGYENHDVSATGMIAFQADWLTRRFGSNVDRLALIDVTGSSMEPTFYDGDTIMVDTLAREVDGGGLFVLRLDGDLFVKRVQRLLSGRLQVISDNPAFKSEQLEAGAESQLEIVGKVIWPRSR